MTTRHFVYRTLQHPDILALLAGVGTPPIWAKKSMTSSVQEVPYLVYKMGNETSEEFSEDRDISRQFWQVWVHDFTDGQTADYERIDAIVKVIRRVFNNAGSIEDDVYTTRYLETSADLDDDTLNTVFRYLRFQTIKEER